MPATWPAPAGLAPVRFETALRREVTRSGGQKPCLRIARRVFTAIADPAGVAEHRRGALERAQLLVTDRLESQRRLADTGIPGRAMPSETTLMKEHGVSRGTVRKAIDTLIEEAW